MLIIRMPHGHAVGCTAIRIFGLDFLESWLKIPLVPKGSIPECPLVLEVQEHVAHSTWKFMFLCGLSCDFANRYLWTHFYALISSVVNIPVLTNKKISFWSIFLKNHMKITWKDLHVKYATCSCTCTNQGLSDKLFYGTRGILSHDSRKSEP